MKVLRLKKNGLIFAAIVVWAALGYLQLHWAYVGWAGEAGSGDLVWIHSPTLNGYIPGMEEHTHERMLAEGLFPRWYSEGHFTVIVHLGHGDSHTPVQMQLLATSRVIFMLGLVGAIFFAGWRIFRFLRRQWNRL